MEAIQQIRCGSVNCYLVKSGKSAILVDTGREAYKEKILRICTADHDTRTRRSCAECCFSGKQAMCPGSYA